MFVDFDVEPGKFTQTNLATFRDRRRYYVHNERLFLVVLRSNLSLDQVIDKTVDANMGWDEGTPGFVDNKDIGKKHSKMTVYRISDSRAESKLTTILKECPVRTSAALHNYCYRPLTLVK